MSEKYPLNMRLPTEPQAELTFSEYAILENEGWETDAGGFWWHEEFGNSEYAPAVALRLATSPIR
tara:strand:+ start:288 stop:482 length:195 start_codon:yes stop_codon:yes gene_type:complete